MVTTIFFSKPKSFTCCLSVLQGIILVYDITNQKSFDNIQKWLSNIEMVCSLTLLPLNYILSLVHVFLLFNAYIKIVLPQECPFGVLLFNPNCIFQFNPFPTACVGRRGKTVDWQQVRLGDAENYPHRNG